MLQYSSCWLYLTFSWNITVVPVSWVKCFQVATVYIPVMGNLCIVNFPRLVNILIQRIIWLTCRKFVLYILFHSKGSLSLRISVSNGSSFGPGGYYRSAWQRPYPIKNRRFFKRTITFRPQILIREYSVWYVKYAALHGASFGRLRFSISLNLSKRQPKNLVFTPQMTIMSKPRAEF